MMVRLLFVAASNSHILISIALSCASINAYTFVDGCTFASTMYFFPCVRLRYLCLHKLLFHNFVFLQFFNEH
jgi:hypothetical protein